MESEPFNGIGNGIPMTAKFPGQGGEVVAGHMKAVYGRPAGLAKLGFAPSISGQNGRDFVHFGGGLVKIWKIIEKGVVNKVVEVSEKIGQSGEVHKDFWDPTVSMQLPRDLPTCSRTPAASSTH